MKNEAGSIGIVCDPKCAAVGVRPLSKDQQQRKGDLTGLEGGCREMGRVSQKLWSQIDPGSKLGSLP